MDSADSRMTGVGCFAGGVTLARVLRRMMDAYSLGDWRAAEDGRQTPSPALRALQTLMNGALQLRGLEDGDRNAEDIAGFFLNFQNQQLSLSVFTRGRGKRCRKYTASLGELTRLRRSRLH